jgi:hypothetical protein
MLDSSANSVSKSVGDVGNNAATNRARRPSIEPADKGFAGDDPRAAEVADNSSSYDLIALGSRRAVLA